MNTITKRLTTTAISACVTLNANAQWHKRENKDDLDGVSRHVYTLDKNHQNADTWTLA